MLKKFRKNVVVLETRSRGYVRYSEVARYVRFKRATEEVAYLETRIIPEAVDRLGPVITEFITNRAYVLTADEADELATLPTYHVW